MDTIQDYHSFSNRITDLLTDYIRYSNWIDPEDGIYVDTENDVYLINKTDISDPDNFYSISSFIVEEDGKFWISIDRIEDVTAKYIFVR
ncbi:MAG: XisI protein [Bacteroidaceae bacterium]|nr:XisI protein [Bacteroidaceae bacterium]